MLAQLDFPGFAPGAGYRRYRNHTLFAPDAVPVERSRANRRSHGKGGALMKQPDLFDGFGGPDRNAADAAIDRVVDTATINLAELACTSSSNDRSGDQTGAAPGAPRAGQPDGVSTQEAPASRAFPDRPGADPAHERAGDVDEVAVVDPTWVGLPANARARLAGDIVVCATPPASFAQALRLLAASGTLTETRLKALRADVGWIEQRRSRERDGSAPAPLPCDPETLRPILAKIRPGQHKISAKRLYNIKSSLASIQRKTGWLPPGKAREPIRTAQWARVLGMIDNEAARGALRGFAVFCEARGITPEAVVFGNFEAYGVALRGTNRKVPGQIADTARYRWNGLAESHADFPGHAVPNKPHHKTFRDPEHGIPVGFTEDLGAYLSKLRKPGPFARGFRRAVAETTVKGRGNLLTCSAHRLVGCGWDTATLTSLGAILTPTAVEAILTDFAERNSGESEPWTQGAVALAQALKMAARQWGNLSEADLKEVEEICDSVKAERRGYSEKKLERLAQFDDPKVERRFLRLPETLWTKASKLAKRGKLRRAAEIAKYAVAIAILFDKPLRSADLAILDLALDFARDAKGRIIGIRIGAGRASKRAPVVEGALSRETVRMIDIFVVKYRLLLVKNETTALFPGCKGAHNRPASMAVQIRKTIKSELALEVNAHLFRSYVGTLILDEDPRAAALAQRVLGHQDVRTTTSSYALQRGRAVKREYAELLERRRRRLQRL